MAVGQIQIGSDYLNVVHKVTGDTKVIEYLRRGSAIANERLFFFAKRDGRASFFFKDQEYFIVRNRDASFSIFSDAEERELGVPLV